MIPHSLVLLSLTMDELENVLGSALFTVFAGPQALLLMGLLFLIFVAIFSLSVGAGFEGTIILLAFALFILTAGISVTGGGAGNILPTAYLFIFLIMVGYVLYLAFFRRDF